MCEGRGWLFKGYFHSDGSALHLDCGGAHRYASHNSTVNFTAGKLKTKQNNDRKQIRIARALGQGKGVTTKEQKSNVSDGVTTVYLDCGWNLHNYRHMSNLTDLNPKMSKIYCM